METQKNKPLENRELNATESLALIARMIENTRRRMERNAGRPFLLWGYLTLAFTAATYAAIACTHDTRWAWLWFGLPLCGWLGMTYMLRRSPNKGTARTFIDRVISQIWMVMGIVAFVMTLAAAAFSLHMPIFFLITLLMGIGCTLTGLVCRFTPSVVGGFICIGLAPFFLMLHGYAANTALFGIAFIAMMIVPGHILNYRANRQAQQNHV